VYEHAREGAVLRAAAALVALASGGVEAGLEDRAVEHLEPALRAVPPQRAALLRERCDDILESLWPLLVSIGFFSRVR
jgi:hypothetical protein